MNDRNSRIHLIRLEKARYENEEKKSKVFWNPKNPKGSLVRQTSHYSNNLTFTLPNSNSTKSLINNNEFKTLVRNNSICGSGLERNKTLYNLHDTKRNLKTELLNIECLTINTESDIDFDEI